MSNTKRYRNWITQALREKGPLTAADITVVVKNGTTGGGSGKPPMRRRLAPTRNQVAAILSKFPEFRKVGAIRVPQTSAGSGSSTGYAVPLWDTKEETDHVTYQ
jgi:hypothetical protein